MTGIRPVFDVYSVALLTAMALALAALVATLAHAAWGGGHLLDGAGRLCLVAFGFAVFALSFHYRVGHPAGSAEALEPLAFVGAHRAMAAVVGLTAGLAVFARWAATR